MRIVIASGKGGTGKTTVSTNLACYLAGKQPFTFLDLDVEEPNAHIFFKPDHKQVFEVYKTVPEVNSNCNFCGECAEICAFNALAVTNDSWLLFSEMCHSCGTCFEFCPTKALSETRVQLGEVRYSQLPGFDFYDGQLKIGEVAAPEVIASVKSYLKSEDLVIMDAPPGASCSVVESLKDADFCLLVAEPTPFGLSDLKLMVELLKDLSLPAGIIINQAESSNNLIEEYANRQHIPVLGRIPFDREIAECYAKGQLFIASIPRCQELLAGIIPAVRELMDK